MTSKLSTSYRIALVILGIVAGAAAAAAQSSGQKQGRPYGYGPYDRSDRRYNPEAYRRGPITPIPRPRTFEDLSGPGPSPPPQPRMLPRVGQ